MIQRNVKCRSQVLTDRDRNKNSRGLLDQQWWKKHSDILLR